MINRIGVVTVTYGDRIKLLNTVLEKVLNFKEVTKVVIVDNNSKDEINPTDRRVKVIKNTENKGSAEGYKQGLKELANDITIDFIWLLDDDNLPEFNGFKMLNDLIEKEKIPFKKEKDALLCLRDDRSAYNKVSIFPKFSNVIFPSENSFLGFNLMTVFQKVVVNSIYKKSNLSNKHLYANVPVAPYGGLLFHKDLLLSIGYPMSELFLYSDDNEFSYRIIDNDGRIILVPKLAINDIDKSWFIKTKTGYLTSLLKSSESSRIYYTIRNRVYTEQKYLLRNNFLYSINRTIYLAILRILSIRYKSKERLDYIIQAIKDGENKKLGKL